MKYLLLLVLAGCNTMPTSPPPAPDLTTPVDLAPECNRCLLDMRCAESCNALGVCPTPSTPC